MDKKLLLDNLSKVCKDYHPSWKFIKPISKRLIEEYSKTEEKTCHISVGKFKKRFGMSGEEIQMLLSTLEKVRMVKIKSIRYSFGGGIITINTE